MGIDFNRLFRGRGVLMPATDEPITVADVADALATIHDHRCEHIATCTGVTVIERQRACRPPEELWIPNPNAGTTCVTCHAQWEGVS